MIPAAVSIRRGAVGKAAEALHLSQPAVSQHVKTLEQTAGRPLFERAGRGIAPTAAGHALAAEVSGHVDALGSLRPTGKAGTGLVLLGAPDEVLAEMIVPHASPLPDAGVRLRRRDGLPDDLLSSLLTNQLDVAVLTRIEGAPAKQRHLVHWRDEQFVLIGRPGDEPYTPEDERRFIGYSEAMPMARRYFRTGIADGSLAVLHHPAGPVLNSLHLAARRDREQLPCISHSAEPAGRMTNPAQTTSRHPTRAVRSAIELFRNSLHPGNHEHL